MRHILKLDYILTFYTSVSFRTVRPLTDPMLILQSCRNVIIKQYICLYLVIFITIVKFSLGNICMWYNIQKSLQGLPWWHSG